MSDPIFDLAPVTKVTYNRLLAAFAVSDDGRTFATIDEAGRLMLNGDFVTRLQIELSAEDFDRVRGFQFASHDRLVIFTLQQQTFVADFERRCVRAIRTATELPGSTILKLDIETYATISSHQDVNGIEITTWSLDTLTVQNRFQFSLTHRVRCGIQLSGSSDILLGCVGGTILAWSTNDNRLENFAKVRGTIVDMVERPGTDQIMVGRWAGLLTKLSVSQKQAQEYTEVRGSLSAMAGLGNEQLVLITSQDAIGIDMTTEEFMFYNKFEDPGVDDARFSNNAKHVALYRGSTLEAYRTATMFERFRF